MALKIDNEIVKTSMTEVLMQNIQGFNEGTNGAIALSSHYIMGDMEEYSQLAEIASIVGRRDIAADTAATVKTLSSIDDNSVICYFTTGSIEFKKVDARRYGSDVAGFSSAIGTQIGVGFVNYMLNRVIIAGTAAITSESSLVTGDGLSVVTYTLLNTGLSTFGDASSSIVCWVMNGATYHALMGDGITNAMIDSVAGGIINTGTTNTLGRPAYVTDAAGLAMAAGVAVLGLTVGAFKMAETETREIFSETVGGKENLKVRVQGESDVLIGVKGYSYTGAANPTDAVLGDDANWSLVSTDTKSSAGILINVA